MNCVVYVNFSHKKIANFLAPNSSSKLDYVWF